MATDRPDGYERTRPERDDWVQTPPPTIDDPAPTRATEDRVTQTMIAHGSSFEVFSAVIGVVLAVIGLAGYLPIQVASIAAIAVGLALVGQGSTVATRWHQANPVTGHERTDMLGMSTEMFGGLAAIVLGGLALFGIASLTLVPAAAIVLGLALLLGGPAQPHLGDIAPAPTSQRWQVKRDIVRASSGVMVMGGVAALVLGAIAVAGVGRAIPLALTAFVCVAGALIVAGGSVLARFTPRPV